MACYDCEKINASSYMILYLCLMKNGNAKKEIESFETLILNLHILKGL